MVLNIIAFYRRIYLRNLTFQENLNLKGRKLVVVCSFFRRMIKRCYAFLSIYLLY